MNINTTKDLKTALRNGQWAWPGGYPLYFITSDGAALSFDAVRSEYRQVINSIRHRMNDGWLVVALEINYEDSDLCCEHTGQRIQCAYGDDEEIAAIPGENKMKYKICLNSRILYTYSINAPIESLRYLTDLARSKYGNDVTLEIHTPNDGGMISERIY